MTRHARETLAGFLFVSPWLTGFVLLTALVMFVIVDMDRPRQGIFRAPTALLEKLQADMQQGVP